jgi:hypothetical protein
MGQWSEPAWLHTLDPLNAVLARALLGEHEAATAILAAGRTAATVRALVEQAFASTRTTTEALLRPPGLCWCGFPLSASPASVLKLHINCAVFGLRAG